MGRKTLTNGFMFNFLLYLDILKNIGAQALGYNFRVLINRPINAIKFLSLLINYVLGTYDFTSRISDMLRIEKIVILSYLLSEIGLLCKTKNPIFNVSADGFVYFFA